MNPETTNRRSIYLPLRRSNLPTLYTLFDFGDATSPEGHRASTTVATQALFVMNSPMVIREARNLATNVMKQQKQDKHRIEEIYLRVLDRRPDPGEIDRGLTYISGLRRKWNTIDEAQAWTSLTHALMASTSIPFSPRLPKSRSSRAVACCGPPVAGSASWGFNLCWPM
jgi:hypothetical protein